MPKLRITQYPNIPAKSSALYVRDLGEGTIVKDTDTDEYWFAAQDGRWVNLSTGWIGTVGGFLSGHEMVVVPVGSKVILEVV